VDDKESWSCGGGGEGAFCRSRVSGGTDPVSARLKAWKTRTGIGVSRSSLAEAWTLHPVPSAGDGPFLMPVEDVFSISGATVVTGGGARDLEVGEERDRGLEPTLEVCRAWDVRKSWIGAGGGTPSASLRAQVRRGERAGAGRAGSHPAQVRCEVYVLSGEGAATPFSGYRPQFYFRTRVTGLRAAAGRDGDAGGNCGSWWLSADRADCDEQGLRFAIARRRVGAGVVAKVSNNAVQRSGSGSRRSTPADRRRRRDRGPPSARATSVKGPCVATRIERFDVLRSPHGTDLSRDSRVGALGCGHHRSTKVVRDELDLPAESCGVSCQSSAAD